MKLRHVVPVALLGLGLLAAAPAAQAADFSIYASYFETDDYDDSVGAGFRVGFFDQIQLELGAAYYDTFGSEFDFDLDDPGFDVIALELDVIPVDVGARFNFADDAFYFAGGGTLFLLDSDAGSVDDEFGFYARVGVQFGSFFVEGGYRNVEGTVDDLDDFDDLDDDFQTGIADFDLTGYFVNFGFRF